MSRSARWRRPITVQWFTGHGPQYFHRSWPTRSPAGVSSPSPPCCVGIGCTHRTSTAGPPKTSSRCSPSRPLIGSYAQPTGSTRRSGLLQRAYSTTFWDGTPATIAHTLRVAVVNCPGCGAEIRLCTTGFVSLMERVNCDGHTGWVSCHAGHIQRGPGDRRTRCRACNRFVNPAVRYTPQRRFRCYACGHQTKIHTAAPMRWVTVLVERTAPGRREIDMPTAAEVAAADDKSWPAQPRLPAITAGLETDVLIRHGITRWDHAFPRRQQAMLHALLAAIDSSAQGDDQAAATLRAAVTGSVEMAGHLSRWDARYLKPYEAVTNHRYNFTTLSAEPNVWGAPQSGRGTVNRRLEHLGKAGNWYGERLGRSIVVCGPIGVDSQRTPVGRSVNVRVVAGSSVRLVVPEASIDLVCTDPPYHDDVMYGELSELLRAWSGMGIPRVDGEAVVSDDATDNVGYEDAHRCLH